MRRISEPFAKTRSNGELGSEGFRLRLVFPTPAQDLELARRALASGDLHHAAHHVACAIAIDPLGPPYLELIDELIRQTDDPLALAPTEDGAFYGTVALRAYIHAQRGEYEDAIDLVMQVVGAKPDVPYLEWVDRWFERDGVIESVDPEMFAISCQKCIDSLDQPKEDPRFAQAALPEVVKRIGRVREHHRLAQRLGFVHSIAARRAGNLDLSLEVASELDQAAPSYLVSVALAGAHRERGDIEEAINAFRRALQFEPEDIAARLDIGDLSLDLGETAAALVAYEEALEIEANHPWALASKLYLKWLHDGDPTWRDELEALTEASPDNDRARQLLDAGTPYVGFLPEPAEASVNAASRVIDQFSGERSETGTSVEMETSCLEAPSAHLSTQRLLRRVTGFHLVVQALAIPDPDPRDPWGEVTYRLWRYDGVTPSPAMGPPDPEVGAQLAEIALSRFSIEDWKARARRVGRAIGFTQVESVLGAMLHPPARPEHSTEWVWMFRVQVAAALVLLYIDEGWEDSVRRHALMSLLLGPIDWTSSAAIIALTELARDEPEHGPMVIDRFLDLLDRRPGQGYWCVEHPLVSSLLRIPGVPEDIVAELRSYEL